MKTFYSHNNSHGVWLLTDSDWFALEAAGWEVDWLSVDPAHEWNRGILATEASINLSKEEAIKAWAKVLPYDPLEEGCECCGNPHYFSQSVK